MLEPQRNKCEQSRAEHGFDSEVVAGITNWHYISQGINKILWTTILTRLLMNIPSSDM